MTDRVVVVGGGQAGLAAAACLRRRGIESLVLDAGDRIGDSWRARYDSLVLFTPSQYDGLPGVPFPAPKDRYPTKDEVAAYLEAYAADQGIEVRSRSRVVSLEGEPGSFVVRLADGEELPAAQVVVATGANQQANVPPFASALDPRVHQLHSSAYRNPAQLPPGSVLIVGAGNSGGQIAEDLVASRQVTLAYGRLPRPMPQRFLGRDIIFWLVVTGVMHRPSSKGRADSVVVPTTPLIGSAVPRLVKQGRVARRPRAVGVDGERVVFADGSTLAADVVIWSTGYRVDFRWIAIDGALEISGAPRHQRGVSPVDGLYFVGLPGLHSLGSGFLGFCGRDAEHVASQIDVRRDDAARGA